jgi:DNA invertase Pin-like site-specific DNA recombinase
MTPTRAIGYVRLSRETADSTSIARQRQIIEATARGRGFELVGIIEDVDVSASKRRLDRPGLAQVRELVAKGQADAVLVWRLDRLARSVVDFGTLLDEGLSVVSCTEPLDTTSAMGRAMAEVLQVFAALESRTIGDRLRSTIAYRVGQGDRWRGGPAPYGYKSVPHPSGDGKTLTIEASEADYIRQAADIVMSGGSLYRAMLTIRDAGSTPRKAESWSLSSLRAVLVGDSVLGRQTRKGSVIRDSDGVIATPWPPVLPLADAERLRALLKPAPLAEKRRKASRMLSGLLVCATCGKRLRVNSRRKEGAKVESYGCRANADGKRCEQPASINADALEASIESQLLDIAGDRAVREHREVIRDAPGLATVEEAIAHTTDAMREPGADLSSLTQTLAELVSRRDALVAMPIEPSIEEHDTGETYRDLWARAETPEERRILVSAALSGPILVRPVGRGHRLPPAQRISVPWAWPHPAESLSHDEGESHGPGDIAVRRQPSAKRV